MNFFFEKWKTERHYDSYDRIEGIEHSTHFTVDGVPFSATFDSLIDSDIYIYHEPGHTEAAVIYNALDDTRTNYVESIIQNHFEDAVALADLIRGENSKITEATQ